MTKTKAFWTLLSVIPLVGVYLWLARLLDIREGWAGFLFITVWSMVEDMKPDRLPLTIVGAEVGIALGTMPLWLGPVIGTKAAAILMILLILAAIYALLLQWLPLLANKATMIFLTTTTIPYVAGGAKPAQIAIGAAFGALYFGGLSLGMARLGRFRNPTDTIEV